MAARSPLWDDIHNPRLSDRVRASAVETAAANLPLVAAPRAANVASSHRTARTIATPLGPTTRFAIR